MSEEKYKTKALVVESAGHDFQLQDVIIDDFRADEVLVEMKYSGICHTDLVFQKGLVPTIDFPAVLGHEGAGEIKAIGSAVKNKDLKVGDPVVLSFNWCTQCNQCQDGQFAFCDGHVDINHTGVRASDGSTPIALIDGRRARSQFFGQSSFAKLNVVHERCITKCPYPDKLAVFSPLGCGFQTGAGSVLNVLKPKPRDSLVVFGMGTVGLTAVMAAKYSNVQTIIGVDLVPEKLDLAREFGATHVINGKDTADSVAALKIITGGGTSYSIDCTGAPRVIQDAIDCLGPRGTAAIVGVPPPGAGVTIDPLSLLLGSKTVTGIIEGGSVPPTFIPHLMELCRDGHLPIDRLCQVYPVAQFDQAIADLKNGKVVKPIISWD